MTSFSASDRKIVDSNPASASLIHEVSVVKFHLRTSLSFPVHSAELRYSGNRTCKGQISNTVGGSRYYCNRDALGDYRMIYPIW